MQYSILMVFLFKGKERAMLDIDTMNTSAQGFTIPAFTDEEGVIRYAQRHLMNYDHKNYLCV